MHSQLNYIVASQRPAELMKAAERDRLAAEAKALGVGASPTLIRTGVRGRLKALLTHRAPDTAPDAA